MLKKLSDYCLLLGIALMLLAYFLPPELMYQYAFTGIAVILSSIVAEWASKENAPSTRNTGSKRKKNIIKAMIAQFKEAVK